MNSRVHPKYKTKYRVTNWPEYERGLVQRGNVTIWLSPEALASWRPGPDGLRGGQRRYSDLAIETALTFRLVFHLPLRQTERILNSVFDLMGIALAAPDHATLSRRSQGLDVALRRVTTNEPIHLIVDRTGFAIVGEGEWAAAKHGVKGKRGWKKLHLGVDGSGVIVARVLTSGHADDAAQIGELLDAVEGDITAAVADAAHDTVAVYGAASACDAEVIVPPTKTAAMSRRRPRFAASDRTIMRIAEIGRPLWKKESGHRRQGTVENAFFRYKTVIGRCLRARHAEAQKSESRIACNVLNRMLQLSRPATDSIGA